MSPILLPMFLFALAGAISPGPVNLMAASIGASTGFFKALPHVTGASVSYAGIVWLVGRGFDGILQAYPEITYLLQWMGAAYLLYLAVKIATARPIRVIHRSHDSSVGLLQGILLQGLNPKAWLVAMSGVSLFVTSGPNASVLLLTFCCISGVVCFFSIASWAALGRLIGKWLTKVTYQVMFNRAMASMLAITVVSMLFST